MSLLELEDYCHLQELFRKTTVTVIVNFRDSFVRIGRLLSVIYKNSFGRTLSLSSLSLLKLEDDCHLQELHGRLLSLSLSTSGTHILELEDYSHLQERFWKTIVTVIANFRDSYARIGRLLVFTRTLLEDHCHCHHCHC